MWVCQPESLKLGPRKANKIVAGVDEERSWEGVMIETQKSRCQVCGWCNAKAWPHTLGVGPRF